MVKRIALALACSLLLAVSASSATIMFLVPMDGQQEVDGSGNPGQGDLDGIGGAVLLIDDVALTITWAIAASNIDAPVAAHLHNAAAGSNGPIRIDFSGQLNGSGLADPDLADVLADPTQWYVNVHTSAFPAGAIRGQLPPRVVAEPATLGLLAAGGSLLALRRRRSS